MLKAEHLYRNKNEITDNNVNNNETQSIKNAKNEIFNKYSDSVFTFRNLKVKEKNHIKRVVIL